MGAAEIAPRDEQRKHRLLILPFLTVRSSAAEIQTIDEPLHQHNCTHYSGVTQLAHSASRGSENQRHQRHVATADHSGTTGRVAARDPRLFQAVIDHYERQIAELKGELSALKKTPRNSSLPPSTEHPHAKPAPPRQPSGKKAGGQPGHPKHERTLIPSKECSEVVTLLPSVCRRCGDRLRGQDAEPLRHQVWELPEIRPLVTEYQLHRLSCPACGITTCAELPPGVPTGQAGPQRGKGAERQRCQEPIPNWFLTPLFTAVGDSRPDANAQLAAASVVTTWTVAYAQAQRRQRQGGTSDAATSVFLDLIDRGFAGVRASMKGTPYA